MLLFAVVTDTVTSTRFGKERFEACAKACDFL
jgi:hypothetical protein